MHVRERVGNRILHPENFTALVILLPHLVIPRVPVFRVLLLLLLLLASCGMSCRATDTPTHTTWMRQATLGKRYTRNRALLAQCVHPAHSRASLPSPLWSSSLLLLLLSHAHLLASVSASPAQYL